jgi:hypothetical protein
LLNAPGLVPVQHQEQEQQRDQQQHEQQQHDQQKRELRGLIPVQHKNKIPAWVTSEYDGLFFYGYHFDGIILTK